MAAALVLPVGPIRLILVRVLLLAPVLAVVAWIVHAMTGFLAVVLTYFFNSTMGYSLSPRSFNIIVYGLAYFLMAVAATESEFLGFFVSSNAAAKYSNTLLFFACVFFGSLGWMNARRFSVPVEKRTFSFSTRQMFAITAWIALSLPVLLANSNFSLLVTIGTLATCIVLLAGRIFGR